MKKNLLIGLAALAAVTITSCQKDQVINQVPQEQAIEFGTYLGRDAMTKATVTYLDQLKTSSFGVYAYYTNTNENYNTSSSPANFMRNQKITWETDKWTYSPLKYWPNNATDRLTFFAYAPYFDETANPTPTANITSVPKNTTENDVTSAPTGDPKIYFTVSTTIANQIDLLYATNNNTNLPKPATGTKTTFNFQHALTRIGFSAEAMINKVAQDATNTPDDDETITSDELKSETTITINSITINGNFYTAGSLNLNGGTWTCSSDNNTTTSYTVNSTELATASVTEDKASLNRTYQTPQQGQSPVIETEQGYIMIIPKAFDGSAGNALTITVNYTVKTTDNNLAEGFSSITNNITSSPFSFTFAQGKAYNFALHIGLNSVEFDAEVTDWDDSTKDIAVNVPINNN